MKLSHENNLLRPWKNRFSSAVIFIVFGTTFSLLTRVDVVRGQDLSTEPTTNTTATALPLPTLPIPFPTLPIPTVQTATPAASSDVPPLPNAMPKNGQVGSPIPPPVKGSTAEKLQAANNQDSGVGLHFFYLQPEIGFGVVSTGSLLPKDPKNQNLGIGPAVGVRLGAELVHFEVGAQFRAIPTSKFNLWQFGAEFHYQFINGAFFPRIGLGGGYTFLGGISQDGCLNSCGLLAINGGYIGPRFSVQYFVSKDIELGANAFVDLLFLKRGAITTMDTFFREDKSTIAVAAGITGHIGFHF